MRAWGSMAAAVALVGACWQPPRAPDGTVAIAGAIWTTPAKPWRYPGAVSHLVPDGDTALALMASRQIARIDLRTGALLAVRAHPTFALAELLHLRDGRWLVAGTVDGAFAAALLDPRTLALAPVRRSMRAICRLAISASAVSPSGTTCETEPG